MSNRYAQFTEICYSDKQKYGYESVCRYAKQAYKNKLNVDLTEFPSFFVYSKKADLITGCIGFTRGDERNPLLAETYFKFDLLRHVSGGKASDRKLFGEIGTRVVSGKEPKLMLFLIAECIIHCCQSDIEYAIFTVPNKMRKLADILNIKPIEIGKPDLSGKDEKFLNDWKIFLSRNPESFGISIEQAARGSFEIRNNYKNHGVVVPIKN